MGRADRCVGAADDLALAGKLDVAWTPSVCANAQGGSTSPSRRQRVALGGVPRNRRSTAVIGTTGSRDAQKGRDSPACDTDIASCWRPNMSGRVNVVFKLLEMAARCANEGYDRDHRGASPQPSRRPSGTALKRAKCRRRRGAAT